MARMCVLEAQKFSINIFIARQNPRRRERDSYFIGEARRRRCRLQGIPSAMPSMFFRFIILRRWWLTVIFGDCHVSIPRIELPLGLFSLPSFTRQTQRTENSFSFLRNTEFAIFMTRLDWVECKQQAPSGQWFRSPMSGLGKYCFQKMISV